MKEIDDKRSSLVFGKLEYYSSSKFENIIHIFGRYGSKFWFESTKSNFEPIGLRKKIIWIQSKLIIPSNLIRTKFESNWIESKTQIKFGSYLI